MATKTLNTRFKLKYDTLANWNNVLTTGKGGNYVLLEGEIGICKIPAADSAVSDSPVFMAKVGDGTTAFKDLPWMSSLAGDVYPWAKASAKPSYTAGEVGAYTKAETGTQITNAINALDSSATATTGKALTSVTITNGKITSKTEADLGEFNTNTTYQIVQNSSNKHQIKLQKKEINDSAWSDVSDWITITDNDANQTIKAGSVTFGANDAVGIVGGTNVTVTGNATNKTITIAATDTTYESKTASSGGTAVSLVTTGEKYTWNNKYAKPSGGIPKTDLASAVQTSLGKADSAIQAHQTIASGSTNGTISVAGSDVAVKGLGSAAYTASTAYATSSQGTKADNAQPKTMSSAITVDGTSRTTVEATLSALNTLAAATKTTANAAMPKSGGTFTGAITLSGAPTANLHAATKKYVDDLVAGIDQFRYYVSTNAANTPAGITWSDDNTQSMITGTLAASASTEFCIYMVPDNSGIAGSSTTGIMGATGAYIEYLTIKIGTTYYWENIGTTKADLSDYALKSYVDGKAGVNKVGTVTSVSAASNSGFKITGTSTVNPTIDWDSSVTLILDGGTSTT